MGALIIGIVMATIAIVGSVQKPNTDPDVSATVQADPAPTPSRAPASVHRR